MNEVKMSMATEGSTHILTGGGGQLVVEVTEGSRGRRQAFVLNKIANAVQLS
jgi:hypothetical protein